MRVRKAKSKLKKDILLGLKDAKEGRVYSHSEVFNSSSEDSHWVSRASKREKTLMDKNALSHKEVWSNKRQKNKAAS